MSTIEKQLPTLPTETWIEVLTKHGLSYHDLKRVAGVSLGFNYSFQAPALDALLFRGEPQATLPAGTKVVLHPLLLGGFSFIEKSIEKFEIWDTVTYKKIWKIRDLACVDDFATNPPVSVIKFADLGREGYSFSRKRLEGVRVIDVLKWIAERWNERPSYEVVENVKMNYFEQMGYDSELAELQIESYYDLLKEYGGDHQFWEGWKPVTVNKDGLAVLRPEWYGS
ncbi:hypothetical protein RQP46_001297 [Phenoliferia psychrophenolica]